MVNLFKKFARMKEILNSRTKITSHNRPRLLEEEGRVVIRTWSFIIPNIKDCLLNILMRNRREEKAMGA
jgi:hypothetical protein